MPVDPVPYQTRPTLVFRAKSLVPPPLFDSIVLSIAAIIISLLLFGGFVLINGTNPLDVFSVMIRGGFGDVSSWRRTQYAWESTLIHAAPLLLTALCVALPARVGMVIIGGEGCILLGGLAAALAAHLLPHLLPHASPFVVITSMILSGMLVGGIWTVIPGALRQFRGVNETISSLLLNYIAFAILNHCVEGPMRDVTNTNHPSTWNIGQANLFPMIPGTELHIGLALGLIACVFSWVLMDHTTHGFATRVVGGNPRAARIAGLSIARYSLVACFLGGAFAALSGVVAVGVHGTANDSLAAGYGYDGILVAFVARQSPLAVIPVAIFLGGVTGSGDMMQLELGLSDASVKVFQGILFLVILGLDTWSGRLKDIKNTWFARPLVKLVAMIGKRAPQGVPHASA